MPRKRRAARPYRKLGSPADLVTRGFDNAWAWVDPERTIQRIATDNGIPEADVIAAFNAIHGSIDQAMQKRMQERARHRLPILRERLQEWAPDQWGAVFCEAPELLETLNETQRAAWDAWRPKNHPATSEGTLRLITRIAPGGARS